MRYYYNFQNVLESNDICHPLGIIWVSVFRFSLKALSLLREFIGREDNILNDIMLISIVVEEIFRLP